MNIEKLAYINEPKYLINILDSKMNQSDKILSVLGIFSRYKIIYFANWNAKECLKLIKKPDQRIVDCINEVDKYLKNESTEEKLVAVRSAASTVWSAAVSAARSAARSAAVSAARSTAWSAAVSAAVSAARSAARSAANKDFEKRQVEKLKELIFIDINDLKGENKP